MCLPNNAAELVEFATLAAPSTNLKIVKLGKFDGLCCEGRRKEARACVPVMFECGNMDGLVKRIYSRMI